MCIVKTYVINTTHEAWQSMLKCGLNFIRFFSVKMSENINNSVLFLSLFRIMNGFKNVGCLFSVLCENS